MTLAVYANVENWTFCSFFYLVSVYDPPSRASDSTFRLTVGRIMGYAKFRAHFAVISMLAVLGLITAPTHATTILWNNAGEGNWNLATNWNPQQVPVGPTNNDFAQINNGGTVDVNDAESFGTLGL